MCWKSGLQCDDNVEILSGGGLLRGGSCQAIPSEVTVVPLLGS